MTRNTFPSLFVRMSCRSLICSIREATLLLTSKTARISASLPCLADCSAICIFSPSALMMWLSATSSSAIDVKMALVASSRVKTVPGAGNAGIDIGIILSIQFSTV